MMGAAERPAARQLAAGKLAGDRGDHADVEHLLGVHRRQDRRQAARQHRLAGARRADEQQVMAAGRGHFERPLGRLLALDVAEVGQRCGIVGDARLRGATAPGSRRSD
jgi:hypothetical protein